MKTIIKKTFLLATTLVASAFLLTRCDSGDEFQNAAKNRITINLGGEITNLGGSQLVIDESNPNNNYSRIDSINGYGYGADIILPDSLKDCDLKIIISGKIRESIAANSTIAVSLHGLADSIYYWGELGSGVYIHQMNSWVTMKDSLIIDRTKNNARSKRIKIFSRKTNGKGYFDVDDLIVEFKRE